MEETRHRRPTGFVLIGMVALMIGAVAALVLSNGGRGDGERRVSSRSQTVPTTKATPSTTGPPIQYQVRRGDTLTSIAQRFGVSAKRIIDRNQLTNPDTLTEGQTLTIPAAPPVALTITPSSATPGESVQLTLTGAKPKEVVKLEITSPAGVFTGPPHTATEDGTVETSYDLGLADPAGNYNVVARGNLGTVAQGTFRVHGAG